MASRPKRPPASTGSHLAAITAIHSASPRLLVALTDFHVLQGFRPAEEAAATLSALHVDGLDPLIEALQGGTPTGEVFLRLIEWPADDRVRIVAEVAAACSVARHRRCGRVDRRVGRELSQRPRRHWCAAPELPDVAPAGGSVCSTGADPRVSARHRHRDTRRLRQRDSRRSDPQARVGRWSCARS